MEMLFDFFKPILHINTVIVCMLAYLTRHVINHIPTQMNKLESRIDRLDDNHKELSNKMDDLKNIIIDVLKK